MTVKTCQGCSFLLVVGKNLKCGFSGVDIYLHLIRECPKKDKKD
jgi:hypothetical protein